MADALAKQEVVAPAVLEKKVAMGPLSPEQEAAQKIQKKLDTDGPRPALESMMHQNEPVNRAQLQEARKKNFEGMDINPATGDRVQSADQTNRENRQKTAEKRAADFLDVGFDKLGNPAPGTTSPEQDYLVTVTEKKIREWPAANTWLDTLTPHEQAEAVKNLLRDPEFRKKMRHTFEAATNPQDLLSNTAIDQAREAQIKAEQAEQRAKLAKDAKDKAYTHAKTQAASFEPGGASYKDLAKLTKEYPQAVANKDKFEAQKEAVQREVAGLQTQYNAVIRTQNQAEITRISSQLELAREQERNILRDLALEEAKIAKKDQLEADKLKWPAEAVKLEGELQDATNALSDAQREKFRKQADYNTAKLNKETQEQAKVDAIENAFNEATRLYLAEEGQKAENARLALLAEAKKNAKDPAEAALLDQFAKRWDEDHTTLLGRETTKANKVMITEDMGTLVQQGPDTLIRVMLLNGGMSEADVDAKMQEDEFMKKARGQVAEQVLTKRIQTGKITRDEAAKISTTEWGKDAIKQAIANRSEVQNLLKGLEKDGVIKNGNVGEWLKDKSHGSILMMLLLIFGSIGTAMLLPAGMALKDSLKG